MQNNRITSISNKIIFNANSTNSSTSETIFDISSIKNIKIVSFIDKIIELNFENYEQQDDKNKNFIFQREAAWIRLEFKNNIFRDFIATQIIGIGSKDGIVIEVVGIFDEVSIEYAAKIISDFAIKNNYKVANNNLFFKYQSQIGARTKKDFNFLTAKKVDLTMDPILYARKRLKLFKEMLTLSIIKNIVKTSRKMLAIKIDEEIKYV